jgi:hypothetical protein
MRTGRIVITLIELIFDAIAILLGLRILLRFLGANPSTPFVNWIYETTGSLIFPFAGIFPNPRLSGSFVIDVAAIIALVIYSLIGYIVLGLIADFGARILAHDHHH